MWIQEFDVYRGEKFPLLGPILYLQWSVYYKLYTFHILVNVKIYFTYLTKIRFFLVLYNAPLYIYIIKSFYRFKVVRAQLVSTALYWIRHFLSYKILNVLFPCCTHAFQRYSIRKFIFWRWSSWPFFQYHRLCLQLDLHRRHTQTSKRCWKACASFQTFLAASPEQYLVTYRYPHTVRNRASSIRCAYRFLWTGRWHDYRLLSHMLWRVLIKACILGISLSFSTKMGLADGLHPA